MKKKVTKLAHKNKCPHCIPSDSCILKLPPKLTAKDLLRIAHEQQHKINRLLNREHSLLGLLKSAYGFVDKHDNVGFTRAEMREELGIVDASHHFGFCHRCQLRRGGKTPKGQGSITATLGTCSMCGRAASLIPDCDYNWPKEGKKAIFD